MKLQDYCLSEEVHTQKDPNNIWSDPIVLQAGTFVKMIDERWVPKHVKDYKVNESFNPETDVYCYCSAGIVSIPRKSIRKI